MHFYNILTVGQFSRKLSHFHYIFFLAIVREKRVNMKHEKDLHWQSEWKNCRTNFFLGIAGPPFCRGARGSLPLCPPLSTALCTSQTVQTYFVTPNASTKCPGDPCYNLATYAQNSEEYFQSYSTFIFLPGVHHLDSMSPAVFQDLQDIQLRASDDFSFVPRTVSNFVRQYGFDSYASDDSINFYESSVQIVYVTARPDLHLLI